MMYTKISKQQAHLFAELLMPSIRDIIVKDVALTKWVPAKRSCLKLSIILAHQFDFCSVASDDSILEVRN